MSGFDRNRYAREWYAKNRERVLARERLLSCTRPSRQPAARAAAHQRRRARLGLVKAAPLTDEERRARRAASVRKWYLANRDKVRKAQREREKRRPLRVSTEESRARRRQRYARRRDVRIKALVDCRRRQAAQLKRAPPWLTRAHQAEIEGIYHFAKVMERITGQRYHVDHIEPLQGSDVSGLHVPWNLRAIPAADNARKGNRREEIQWQPLI